ncbi:unnamed protein product [Linum trigynum]|uniref:Uncharacterized protein n=1 Tax=Linum trigynum TaxID=586398 RepID=A0AAV2C9P1_9ROSI
MGWRDYFVEEKQQRAKGVVNVTHKRGQNFFQKHGNQRGQLFTQCRVGLLLNQYNQWLVPCPISCDGWEGGVSKELSAKAARAVACRIIFREEAIGRRTVKLTEEQGEGMVTQCSSR